MKRTPGILLILIPFSVISIRAQTPGQSLKLDFGSREFDDASLKQLNKINEGDFYKIVIENINTYLYRIELTVNDVIINPDVKIPTFDDFALESLTSLISGLPGLSIDPIELIDVSKNESLLETFAKDNKIEKSGSIESRLQKEEDQIKAYLEEITVIQKQINGWRHKAQLHDYTTTKSFDVGRFIAERPDTTLLKNLHKSIVDDQKKYLEEIQKFSELSQEKYKQRHMLILDTYNKVLIPSIQTSLTALGDKALINILISLAQRRIDVERRLNLSSSLLDLSPITEAIRDWWMSVYKYTGLLKLDEPQTDVRNLTVKEMHTDIIRKPTAILSDISLKRNTMITQRTNYQNEISKYSSRVVFAGNTSLLDADKAVLTAYDSLAAALDRCANQTDPTNTLKLLTLASYVYNHRFYSYSSLPLRLNGDQANVVIQITPRDTSTRLQSYTSGQITFPNLQRKPYFSSGMGFYIAGLYNEAYTITQRDTLFTPVKEDHAKSEIGTYLNAALHIPVLNSFQFGIAIGPALSLSKPIRPRLTAGLFVSYGKRTSVLLNFGVIAGSVDRKSSAIMESTEYTALPTNIVVSKIDTGLYVGLTINRKF